MIPLHLKGVGVSLRGREILRDITLAVQPGGMTALVGPNGAGKSTLLRASLGLVPLSSGEILLQGRNLTAVPLRERARLLAYLAQGHHAIWPIRVRRLVGLGRLPYRGWSRRAAAMEDALVEAAMARCGVMGLADRTVDTLSGGEKARVMLARALAVGAEVLLVDEPIAALDPRHQLEVMAQLRMIARGGTAVVCVLHDLQMAARFCDRVAVLAQGRIVVAGPPETALSPDVLRPTYGIETVKIQIRGQQLPVAWEVTD
ncbi:MULTISPECIES: ABC transporter ATP-binding protein [unclassified Paracoccus (in: a-proteobacteria)]|uniref:ABC transporter ATP-binding protein n=1 Tax=unclassified Paracoccus (in: a-proteobacteria) TaxID=2688777 RepID=UPI00048C6E32|nr:MULTISPECIES: ABC transporter ATP-binding protein [unclassified Paracoccus (in: a-proteobacteria)]